MFFAHKSVALNILLNNKFFDSDTFICMCKYFCKLLIKLSENFFHYYFYV